MNSLDSQESETDSPLIHQDWKWPTNLVRNTKKSKKWFPNLSFGDQHSEGAQLNGIDLVNPLPTVCGFEGTKTAVKDLKNPGPSGSMDHMVWTPSYF